MQSTKREDLIPNVWRIVDSRERDITEQIIRPYQFNVNNPIVHALDVPAPAPWPRKRYVAARTHGTLTGFVVTVLCTVLAVLWAVLMGVRLGGF